MAGQINGCRQILHTLKKVRYIISIDHIQWRLNLLMICSTRHWGTFLVMRSYQSHDPILTRIQSIVFTAKSPDSLGLPVSFYHNPHQRNITALQTFSTRQSTSHLGPPLCRMATKCQRLEHNTQILTASLQTQHTWGPSTLLDELKPTTPLISFRWCLQNEGCWFCSPSLTYITCKKKKISPWPPQTVGTITACKTCFKLDVSI